MSKIYKLKCIKEPKNKQYGRDLIKVGETYKCSKVNASNWNDIYAVHYDKGGHNCGIEVPKDCFEPIGIPYKEIDKGIVSVRITNGYGIATNYCIENKCPKCGAKLVKVMNINGCYDGEFTCVDEVSCKNGCEFTYTELVPKRMNMY